MENVLGILAVSELSMSQQRALAAETAKVSWAVQPGAQPEAQK